jgi:hypothetical protein
VDDYGHILSYQALNAATFRDPDVGKAYPVLKHPWVMRLVGGKILLSYVYRDRGMRWSGVAISDSGCMISQPFIVGGN